MTAFEDSQALPSTTTANAAIMGHILSTNTAAASPGPTLEPTVRQEATEVPEVPLGANVLQNVAAAVEAGPDEANPFALSPDYAYTPRKVKVITIGAGFSGLLMAHKFQHRFPEMRDIVEHKIFESLHDVGGTWLLNNYPGVQCDVPAHIYVSIRSSTTVCRIPG